MMKRFVPLALAIVLMAAALPALAADGYPDNILLDTGVPYGNYGYPGLVKLHNGDAAKIDAHMRSAKSNQQGGGIGYRASTTTTAASKINDLVAQAIARLTALGEDYAIYLEWMNSDVDDGMRDGMNAAISSRLAESEWDSLSDVPDGEALLMIIFGDL